MTPQDFEKHEFVIDHRAELINALYSQCREGKTDELKYKLAEAIANIAEGYFPCELALALEIVTLTAFSLNFDLKPQKRQRCRKENK